MTNNIDSSTKHGTGNNGTVNNDTLNNGTDNNSAMQDTHLHHTRLSSNELEPTKLNHSKPSLVPKSLTVGLAIFALILSLAGYVFRIIAGHPVQEVLRHAAVLVPLFVIVIPFGFWVGALVMNKVKGLAIQRRNALTLGWLISCVTMLWFMGTYS